MRREPIGYPNLPGEFYISDVKFIHHNLDYVTGSQPGIAENLYRTTDGATLTVLTINAGYSLHLLSANHGWAINIGGLGYRVHPVINERAVGANLRVSKAPMG